MHTKTVPIPENAIVKLLSALPEKMLAEIFWKTFVYPDYAPLTKQEKREIGKAKAEYAKRKSVIWQDIR